MKSSPATASPGRWASPSGLIAAGLLFSTGNVLPVPSHPPAMLDIQAVPTGELGFDRQRPLIDVRDLRPGRTAPGSYGATMLSNLTGKPMRVQSRLVTAGHDLDHIVRARLMLGNRVMATGHAGAAPGVDAHATRCCPSAATSRCG